MHEVGIFDEKTHWVDVYLVVAESGETYSGSDEVLLVFTGESSNFL